MVLRVVDVVCVGLWCVCLCVICGVGVLRGVVVVVCVVLVWRVALCCCPLG